MPSLTTAITRRAKVLLFFCGLGAALPLVVGWLPDGASWLAWVPDLAVHWQWVYLLVGGVCALGLLAQRAFVWAVSGGVVLVLGPCLAMPGAPAGATGAQVLTVVSANLHADNDDPAELRRWTQGLDADVIVLQEVNPRMAAALAGWADYPYRMLAPAEGPFGLAVLSRLPLEQIECRVPPGQTLHARMQVHWGAAQVVLVAVHPMPPISPQFHARRRELLATASAWGATAGLPVLIAGDLNASPWSSAMHPPAQGGWRRATALTPTWPASLPMIPIDQILVTRHWRVLDAGVGPRIGSDHRPVYVRLSMD
ncbi:endonuclease/exonuclease/phosphatase family protein [Azoarcus sp. L1K30]|uniref:endonuclease/exonuclease/phosphatase family protein n=1 Tax=Azoarcus sp. L1K30 TaxID=2820277 RepID=UPI001B81098E|nr:endonuclease/exonuclease/phosphatase family protein [Azoarcus sp. L1K30]MBR0565613.1 endonuclease/exonuclease/phosphatase family protein [Azoarcus sp. L1K30]